MSSEKKLLRMTMTIFFLAIIFVYGIFFMFQRYVTQKQAAILQDHANTSPVATMDDTTTTIDTGNTGDQITGGIVTNTSGAASGFVFTSTSITTTTTSNLAPITTPFVTDTTGSATPLSGNIVVLSGTHLFFGGLEALDYLGLSYDYILTDNKGIFYAYLWEGSLDLDVLTKKFWWNTFDIVTEKDILANKLFGTKVSFINIPKYKDDRVLMVVTMNNQYQWLIQATKADYYNSKVYLQKMFEAAY